MERQLLTWATWERYTILATYIGNLSVRDRRNLFQLIRNEPSPSPDIFFPTYGFSLSEFAVFHILCDKRRKGPKIRD